MVTLGFQSLVQRQTHSKYSINGRFVSHTHFHRHLLELTGEVFGKGHNLVKGKERLLPKCNKHEFFRSSSLERPQW